MAKKAAKKQKVFDLQTKLTIALATIVLAINCYALSSSFVDASNHNYVVIEEE